MVMHMSRHQKGYGVRREGKMGGGGIRERAKETSVPFPLLSFSPPPCPSPYLRLALRLLTKSGAMEP